MFVSVINHLLLAIDLIMFFSIKIKTLPNWDLNSGNFLLQGTRSTILFYAFCVPVVRVMSPHQKLSINVH